MYNPKNFRGSMPPDPLGGHFTSHGAKPPLSQFLDPPLTMKRALFGKMLSLSMGQHMHYYKIKKSKRYKKKSDKIGMRYEPLHIMKLLSVQCLQVDDVIPILSPTVYCGFGRCGSQGITWWHYNMTE